MKFPCLRAPVIIPGASAYTPAGTFSSIIDPPPKPFDAIIDAGISVYALLGFQRALLTWASATVRLRRGSDNVEADFVSPLSSDVLAWAPSGSVYLVRQYDQTGAGHDAYIATTTLQPTVDLAGTYPVAVFDGTDDYLNLQNALGWSRARDGMSFGFSCKPTVTSGSTRALGTWMAPDGVSSSGAVQATLDMGNTANVMRFVGSRVTGDTAVSLGTPISAGAWQAVVASLNYTSGEASLRNGATIVSASGLTTGVTGDVNSSALPWVGRHRSTGREYSGALAASVWIPQALTNSQSLAVANALALVTAG